MQKKNSNQKKRVLVITPTPTHPQNAGNRARIFSLLKEVRKHGYEIHVLYDGTERYAEHVVEAQDITAMENEWDSVRYVSEESITNKKGVRIPRWVSIVTRKIDKDIGEIGQILRRYTPQLFSVLKPFVPDNFLNFFYKRTIETRGLDRWYTHALDKVVCELAQKKLYDVVLVEYVFLTHAFTHFDDSVLKVLDTHDIFANREQVYKKEGLKESFFSVSSEEESRGFNRADVILAIQEEEASLIRKRTCKPVITVGHVVEGVPVEKKEKNNMTIGFIASGNVANKKALRHILGNVFPIVQKTLPKAKLLVAGSVGVGMPTSTNTTYLGEFPASEFPSVYSKMNVVLNTTTVGTGLKIKCIEALAYGKVVIATEKAVEGIENAKDCLIIAEEDAIADQIITILNDDKKMQKLEEKAKEYSKKYTDAVRTSIQDVFRMPPQQGIVSHGEKAIQPSPFILFTWPRCGATSLTNIFSAHRDIAMYDEPFHRTEGKVFDTGDIHGPHEYVKELQKKRKGIKHNWGLTFEQNVQILLDTEQRIIFFTRENAIQREVSLFIAQHTNWWSERTEGYVPPSELPAIKIEEMIHRIRTYQRNVQRYRLLLVSNAVPFFEFRYEDFYGNAISSEQQMQILSRIGEHIGYSFGKWVCKDECIQRALDPDFTRPDTEDIYRLIPNIEEVAEVAERYGFGKLFLL